MSSIDEIRRCFDQSERIGVVGSPSSSSNLTIDILGTASDKKLVGSLCMFNFMQDGSSQYALGQITELHLRNVWSEDPTMRGLIRQKGRVDPITERQDTHTATMVVSSVFAKNQKGFEASMLGTVPSTGTPVKVVSEEFMKELLSEYSDELVYFGNAYGSAVPMPMWFKHFGQGEGGAGEAYHIGIFGKTGSGKSVLSKMVMLSYAKRKPMTIFVLDPQGEFASMRADPSTLEVISKLGKDLKVYNLHNLVLAGDPLFKKVLMMSGFLDRIGIFSDENQTRAADQIDRILHGKHPAVNPQTAIKPWHYYKKESFEVLWNALRSDEVLSHIYTTKDIRERVRIAVEDNDRNEMYEKWLSFTSLFTYEGKEDSVKISDLTKTVTERAEGQIVVIDLSDVGAPARTLWNDDIRMIVINEFLEVLTREAQAVYKTGRSLNTLVVIDEAHRVAPRERQEKEEMERIRTTIKDAVRTTRKFGLGWLFISQTLSGLDREIINQLRISIFGYGLAYGIELQGLREIIGGNEEAIRLYQMFKDPQSNPKQKEYSFMTIGPASPLSFSVIPLFFQASQYPTEFLRVNARFFSSPIV